MSKVYVVTSGEYSDYSILGVFDSRELADEVVAERESTGNRYNRARVEEYELNPALYESPNPTFRVVIGSDGNVYRCELHKGSAVESFFQPFWSGSDRVVMLVTFVSASRAAGAIKVANERRAMLLAEGSWPSPESLRYGHSDGKPLYIKA